MSGSSYSCKMAAAIRSALVIGDGATSAVRSAVRAAQTCMNNGKVDVLLVGKGVSVDADTAAKWDGVESIFVSEGDSPVTAESATPVIKAQLEKGGYGHAIAAANTFGKNVLPRVAGMMGVSTVSDVIEIREDDVMVRPIYAGNALATVKSTDEIKLLTIRTTAFAPVAERSSGLADIKKAESVPDGVLSRWVREEKTETSRPDLTAAGVVVAGGRGLQSSENFKMLEEIADHLGGAVGATRAAVDLGYVPNDMQVGQTGKVVAPDLYIAVGISGAIQHLAGMKDSKTIVAINKDADAPIFQIADYGLVGDLFEVVPELMEKIKTLPKQSKS